MNAYRLHYYAAGRRTENDGYEDLFTPATPEASASEGLAALRALAATEAGAPSDLHVRPTALPAPLRHPSATFVCMGPASSSPGVFLSRRQEVTARTDLSRGSLLREAILLEKTGDALPDRYFRALAAFADVPRIEAVEGTPAGLASRTTAALASPAINFDVLGRDGQYRRLLARSLAAISMHVQGHTAIVLSPSEAPHRPLALASGLAEILPVGDRTRGFAASSPTIRKVGAVLTRTLDWSVYRSELGSALFEDASGVNVCDLRKAEEDPRQASRANTLEQYLERGAEAAQALGHWLEQRRIACLCDLKEDFWSRLALEVSMLCETQADVPSPSPTTQDIGAWDLEQFLRVWDQAQRRGDIRRLQELVGAVAGRISECPALAGWLMQPPVRQTAARHRDIEQAVQQAVQKAYAPQPAGTSGSAVATQSQV